MRPGVTRRRAIADLGDWTAASSHQMGTFDETGGGTVAFGVWARNGLVQPWAEGPEPTGTRDATADWTGLFLGMTPSGGTVAGDVRLAVRLAEGVSGTLTFRDLEQGDDGTQWGDGTLDYPVTLDADGFGNHGSSGGDAGRVTGVFLGADHKAMAGILRRSDLAGAFGGKQP